MKKKVAKFLKEKHGNNYLIFNLSGRTYDASKFDNHVCFLQKKQNKTILKKKILLFCFVGA